MIAVSALLSCGSDDGGGITDEQRQLVMGQETGIGLFFSDFPGPLVLSRDNVHSNVRELDINSDGVVDIELRAYQDFGSDRGLTLTTANDSTTVSLDAQMAVKALEEGDIVTIASETWGPADALALAVNDGGVVSGNWVGNGNRFIAYRIDIGNSRFLGWIEISVEDFDNYSLYNFALRAVP
jgi:hypothetical protein